MLALYGHGGRGGRAIVGKWVKAWEPYKLIEILVRAAEQERGNVVEYIESALRGERQEATAVAEREADDKASIEDARFRRRVEGFKRTDMLHLLDQVEMARAVKLGLVDSGS